MELARIADMASQVVPGPVVSQEAAVIVGDAMFDTRAEAQRRSTAIPTIHNPARRHSVLAFRSPIQ
jgi:hypothetical protein